MLLTWEQLDLWGSPPLDNPLNLTHCHKLDVPIQRLR